MNVLRMARFNSVCSLEHKNPTELQLVCLKFWWRQFVVLLQQMVYKDYIVSSPHAMHLMQYYVFSSGTCSMGGMVWVVYVKIIGVCMHAYVLP